MKCLCTKCIQAIRSRGEKIYVGDEISLEYEVFADEPQVCDWCGEEASELYEVALKGRTMTVEELKELANSMGYNIAPKPNHDCSCWNPYPNECYKRKDGKWKCVDDYELIANHNGRKTWCRKKGKL